MDRLDIARLSSDGDQRGAYPLTSMQQAYWIGEQNGYRLGTAACLYRGYRAATLDLERLEQALLGLMAAHPALRTRIQPDGTQCIAPMPARCQVPVRDNRHLCVAQQEALVAGWKEALDEHLPDMASSSVTSTASTTATTFISCSGCSSWTDGRSHCSSTT